MCLECHAQIKQVLAIHVSHRNGQTFIWSKETNLMLVTCALGKERQNIDKKLSPVRPKRKGKKIKKKKQWQLQSYLRYTQTQESTVTSWWHVA